ncbi:MAG: acyl-CoA dehydrogenase family protein, partial [Cyanobacteria bacterium J06632_3]
MTLNPPSACGSPDESADVNSVLGSEQSREHTRESASEFSGESDYLSSRVSSSGVSGSVLDGGLESILKQAIAPVANQLDTEPEALFKAFHTLGEHGLLTPKSPASLGGLALNTFEYQQFQALVARYSGALAFLVTQHQSAASLLLSAEQTALAENYLPRMATGEQRVGVGFSQLRRQPTPLLAEPVTGGYRLNGTVPWVTGAGLFTHFVGAAVLPDQSAVFGLLPLVSRGSAGADSRQADSEQTGLEQLNSGEIWVSEPMALAAMSATNTVEVQLENWFLPSDCVVGHRRAGWISEAGQSSDATGQSVYSRRST